MGTPASSEPARETGNQNSTIDATTSTEPIPQKLNYSNVVRPNTTRTLNPNQFGNPEVKARYSTHNGVSAIIFKISDWYGVMAEECKRTLVGKFIRTRPQIEKIRSKFAEKAPLKGNVKIGVYDFRSVFLDFTDEEDFNSVWFKRSIEIEGQVMWLEKWTPDFKPEEDSPIVPVWVLLPDLPFHCHTWHYVKQILAPIGTPLSMDLATDHKTRPSMAKVRVEIDLTKPKLNSIWVGTEDVSFPLKGYNQKLEYENVPKFCRHCKILGHSLPQCRRIEKKNMEEDKIDATKITADNIFEGKIKQHDQGDTTEGQSECNKQVENSDDLNNDKQEYDQGRKKNKCQVAPILE